MLHVYQSNDHVPCIHVNFNFYNGPMPYIESKSKMYLYMCHIVFCCPSFDRLYLMSI